MSNVGPGTPIPVLPRALSAAGDFLRRLGRTDWLCMTYQESWDEPRPSTLTLWWALLRRGRGQLAALHPAPVQRQQRERLRRRDQLVDRDVLVQGVRLGQPTRPVDAGRRASAPRPAAAPPPP